MSQYDEHKKLVEASLNNNWEAEQKAYNTLMFLNAREKCSNFFSHTHAGSKARSFICGPLYKYFEYYSPNAFYHLGLMEFYNTLLGFHAPHESPQEYKVNWCKKDPLCACSAIRNMCYRESGGLFPLKKDIDNWKDTDKEIFIWMTRKFIIEKTNFSGDMSERELSRLKGSIDAARHFFYYDLGCIVNGQKKDGSNGR